MKQCARCKENESTFHCRDLPNVSVSRKIRYTLCFSCCNVPPVWVVRIRWHMHSKKIWTWLYVDLCDKCAGVVVYINGVAHGSNKREAIESIRRKIEC